MNGHSSLTEAKKAKNDEFYTVYEYIQKEINAYVEYNPDVFRGKTVLLPCDDPEWSNFTRFFAQNFETLGLQKLISTSYAINSKQYKTGYQLTLFESTSPQYDETKTRSKGKIFTLNRDTNSSGRIDIDDLEWSYLNGDGDFQSEEVSSLRDEADIIVTNPPFSQFRVFIEWALKDPNKKILVIGTNNAIHYQEVFPLIRDNQLWLGATCNGEDMVFAVPEGTEVSQKDKIKAEKLGYFGNFTRLGNACWFTNLDHGKRHQELSLMSMHDNLKYSKHNSLKKYGYQKYINYDGIEVPYIDAIPADYEGNMGVPVTFMDKYCPEQFEIIGTEVSVREPMELFARKGEYNPGGNVLYVEDYSENAPYRYRAVYKRIIIRRKR